MNRGSQIRLSLRYIWCPYTNSADNDLGLDKLNKQAKVEATKVIYTKTDENSQHTGRDARGSAILTGNAHAQWARSHCSVDTWVGVLIKWNSLRNQQIMK